MTTEPGVTAEQVAQHVGVAKDTIYRWRERIDMPNHRIGCLWRFNLSEVDNGLGDGGARDADARKHDGS